MRNGPIVQIKNTLNLPRGPFERQNTHLSLRSFILIACCAALFVASLSCSLPSRLASRGGKSLAAGDGEVELADSTPKRWNEDEAVVVAVVILI